MATQTSPLSGHKQGKTQSRNVKVLFNSSIFAQQGCSLFWCMLWNYIAEEIQQRTSQESQDTYTIHQIIPSSNWYHAIPEKLEQELLADQTNAILAIGVNISREWVAQHNLHCVTFASFNANEVEADMEEMTYMGTNALMEQGCKRIGLWVNNFQGIPAVIHQTPVYMGFKRAYEEKNLPFKPELVQSPYYTSNGGTNKVIMSQEQGYRLVQDIFKASRNPRPDGLVITDDMMTIGALSAFQDYAIQVGKRLKIATYGNANSPTLFGYTKKLTVVEFDPYVFIQEMFAVLDAMYVGETLPELPVRVKPRLRKEVAVNYE